MIDEAEGNLGVLPLTEALRRAVAKSLDLIEISPEAKPPVAKIMNFGKYKYQQEKKARAVKSHTTETKALQIKIGTGDHDLALKADQASKFLREGHRVKIDLFLRGRSKYFDEKFLRERLTRLLAFISEDYKIADDAKRSLKGLSIIIDRAK